MQYILFDSKMRCNRKFSHLIRNVLRVEWPVAALRQGEQVQMPGKNAFILVVAWHAFIITFFHYENTVLTYFPSFNDTYCKL